MVDPAVTEAEAVRECEGRVTVIDIDEVFLNFVRDGALEIVVLTLGVFVDVTCCVLLGVYVGDALLLGERVFDFSSVGE